MHIKSDLIEMVNFLVMLLPKHALESVPVVQNARIALRKGTMLKGLSSTSHKGMTRR